MEHTLTRRRTGARAAIVALALTGLASTACGGGDTETAVTSFATPLEGTDAFVGLVVDRDDRRVMAYVCDGNAVGTWFTGQADEQGAVNLASNDGARLTGRIAGDRLSGAVSLPGRPSTDFAAGPVRAPAGLYRQRGEIGGQPAVGGWVVLADGRQRGGVRTSAGFTSTDTDLARPNKPVTSFTSTDVDF